MKRAALLLPLLLLIGCGKELPSRREVVSQGGIYPVAVPLGWKLVNESGHAEDIPAVPGDTFHKILAKGAILAQSPGPAGETSEVVMFTALHQPAPINQSMLDRYAEKMTNAAGKSVEEKVMLTDPPRGRLVLVRTTPSDHRIERHYLLADAKGSTWQLVYLVKPENLDAWRPLFAAVEAGSTEHWLRGVGD